MDELHGGANLGEVVGLAGDEARSRLEPDTAEKDLGGGREDERVRANEKHSMAFTMYCFAFPHFGNCPADQHYKTIYYSFRLSLH
jgi:hypothetical protein